MNVLLVDDEEELVATMAERLSMRGIDAAYATSGEAALEMARDRDFDLVVLDVKMPGMHGLELMRRLEAVRPDLKYIFLTGHGSAEDYKACSEAGACSYLIKPANLEALINKIKEALGIGPSGSGA